MKTKFKSVSKAFAPVALPAIMGLISLPSTGLAGSLWREAVTDERGMFADKRAHRLGDIVTIVVTESVEATNEVNTTTNTSSTGSTGLASEFLNRVVGSVASRKVPTDLSPKVNTAGGQQLAVGATGVGINPLGTNGFVGGGAIKNKQVLKMADGMAVQVIDVLPNGNLVVEGIRQVSFAKERQFASLRGIIRPMDVTFSNTVPSSALADARIDVVSEGELSTTQKKGWLKKLDEKISPY